jgi:multicomponent Na+:H+ antiporter subunit B
MVLMAFLAATALAVLRLRSLFAVAMLGGIYSFLSATIFVALDAVDVAFTEASVGAGVSTVLFLTTLALTAPAEKPPVRSPMVPLLVVAITGAALVYATLDMPAFGDPDAPIHQHVAPYYLNNTVSQTTVPNAVTSVVASYRGYDTLGETTVILTAGVGVMLLLGRRRRNPRAVGEAERP